MKKVKTEQAVGMVLCHDITEVRDGFKGRAFARGHVITQEDVPHLLRLGKKHIYIWEENAGEIHEEDAARRLSALAPVEGAQWSGPSEGKMTLTAETDGFFRVNRAILDEINRIGEITFTTLPDHYPVKKGMKLASCRIIPLVCKEEEILQAEKTVRDSEEKLLSLIPYRKNLKAGIIVTGSEVFTGRIQDKFQPVIREKLSAYDADILGCTFCDDDLDMLMDAMRQWKQAGAELIVMTGGMSVDPDDLTPTAIGNCASEVISRGVPAQPGNMFMLAYWDNVTVIGVPGAAIHSKITMLDIALPQIVAGVPFTRDVMRSLGAGGLCQGCGASCRWPNCTFGRY